jgi:uncharacterized protein (DUF2336 family)
LVAAPLSNFLTNVPMLSAKPLIIELEDAVKGGSLGQRISTMKRMTDLFLSGADRFTEDQVALFDNVLCHLVKWVESKALSELSRRFAPVPNAPVKVVQHLARHDDIAVAGPVLAKSERLSNSDLIEIAKKKGQEHLLAISDRARLVEAVTDVLLERGANGVFCKLANNPGASFSKAGFESLVRRAQTDETLAENVGRRADIPRHLLSELVSKATHTVRIKLLAALPSETHAEIRGVLDNVSREVGREIGVHSGDLEKAHEAVLALQQNNQLNEDMLYEFARRHEFENVVAGLALMASAKIELIDRLMQTTHYAGLLIACKVCELKWTIVEVILAYRNPKAAIAQSDLELAKADYDALNKWAAVRLLDYWQTSSSLPA